MRLAILSDIHGNLPALEAVHDHIRRQSVDEVLVAGDLVGRGPQGSAVVRYVRAQDWPTLKGNHEDYLLDFRHRRVPEAWWQLDEWSASRWLAAELTDDDAAFIEAFWSARDVDQNVKYTVGVAMLAFVLAWLFLGGRSFGRRDPA